MRARSASVAERVLGLLRNRLALVLHRGGEDVDGELVGVRVVAGDEIDPRASALSTLMVSMSRPDKTSPR
jgi:hypothetical protein